MAKTIIELAGLSYWNEEYLTIAIPFTQQQGMSKGRSTWEIYEYIQNPATTGNPQLKTICLTIVQSYNGLENVTYSLHLWLFHHPYGHVIIIQELGNWLAFMTDCMIVICNFFCQFPANSAHWGRWIFNDMICLMTMWFP